MTETDRDKFSRVMLMMATGYNAPMNDLRIELYFAALADLPIETIERAVTTAVNRCKFCPTVADLREQIEGTSTDKAELAWITWKDAARMHGAMASLEIEDPALAETILTVFGSWPAACALELTNEMWSSKRKEFERVYRVMQSRELIGMRRLPGIAETQNSRVEWARFTPVVRIGEPRTLAGGQALHPLSLESKLQ